MRIVGAGLAGLIAAHSFPHSRISEVCSEPISAHRALLRFRSDGVSRLTGIPFKPVTVRKGIWYKGSSVQPSIAMANAYSQKCIGRIESERSIWNLEPVTRFIAPDDLYWQLIDAARHRIDWGVDHDYLSREPVISTAPLPVVLDKLGIQSAQPLLREPITVQRFVLADCDVYQTVYFPEPTTSMYRASISGSLLIVEHAGDEVYGPWEELLRDAFALWVDPMFPAGEASQRYGKIAAVDGARRKQLLYQLTRDYHIYSLGRFATWRNLLLDDLLNDLDVLRRMIHASSYDRQLSSL